MDAVTCIARIDCQLSALSGLLSCSRAARQRQRLVAEMADLMTVRDGWAKIAAR